MNKKQLGLTKVKVIRTLRKMYPGKSKKFLWREYNSLMGGFEEWANDDLWPECYDEIRGK